MCERHYRELRWLSLDVRCVSVTYATTVPYLTSTSAIMGPRILQQNLNTHVQSPTPSVSLHTNSCSTSTEPSDMQPPFRYDPATAQVQTLLQLICCPPLPQLFDTVITAELTDRYLMVGLKLWSDEDSLDLLNDWQKEGLVTCFEKKVLMKGIATMRGLDR